MATILLLNFDPIHGSRLAEVLRGRRHHVLNANNGEALPDKPYIDRYQIDLILWDLTHNKGEPWSRLHSLSTVRKANGYPALLLCYSRIYYGPSFELRIEKLGARIVYG